MKYILVFLIALLFIAPSCDKNKSTSTVLKEGFYNYITCLDTSYKYLVDNVPFFNKITEISYKKAYKKVMKDRTFTKHLVLAGETIDNIIQKYNHDVDDLENFRKVVYKENIGLVSDTYEIKSGQYLTIPTD